MAQRQFRRSALTLRLLIAYVVVPLLVPAIQTLSVADSDGRHLEHFHSRYADSLVLTGTITFAAMVILGLPLLFIYLHLNLSSFLAFSLGGAACAVIAAAVLLGSASILLLYYGLIGLIAGVAFRLILFGFSPPAPGPIH